MQWGDRRQAISGQSFGPTTRGDTDSYRKALTISFALPIEKSCPLPQTVPVASGVRVTAVEGGYRGLSRRLLTVAVLLADSLAA